MTIIYIVAVVAVVALEVAYICWANRDDPLW